MSKRLMTTVVGSYPVDVDALSLIRSYYESEEVKWGYYIESAVGDMVKAGVDIISDGQTRDSFINIFIRRLEGCRVRARPEIIAPIRYKEGIILDDYKYVKNMITSTTRLKGVITGPYTLAKSCVDYYYYDTEKAAYGFAEALNEEAVRLQGLVDYISVDEPFYSQELPVYSKELLSTLLRGVDKPSVLHVCGDVSGIIPDLLDQPVDMLSHEFKASSFLLDEFKEYWDDSKMICLGVVRADSQVVETVDEIKNHIDKGLNVFGDRLVHVAPDCGLRLLPRKVAFQKLSNMVEAARLV
jgi:5-methyltetrahydropteroyltriglutamate--homocysteine methyltransferase